MGAVNDTEESRVVNLWDRGHVASIREVHIHVESGPDAGRVFGPLAERTTIGRHVWCDIGLTDPRVSKEHCEVVCTPDGVRLRDLGSTNGITCNCIKIADATLESDASFSIGSSILRLRMARATRVAAAPILDPTGTLVIGRSGAMRRTWGIIERVAPLDLPVLLLGETGTGKTTVVRAMHSLSPRAHRPLLEVNCASLSPTLIDRDLFGHVRGSFTGADRDMPGIFESAAGGAVFLDEIGELSPDSQAKLLTVLEAGTVRPIGSTREVPVNFRLYCATNRDLGRELRSMGFREDLYHRIAGMTLQVPALRERMEDLELLAHRILEDFAKAYRGPRPGGPPRTLSASAWQRMRTHTWSGNVRELQNALRSAAALAEGAEIRADDLLLRTWRADDDPYAPAPQSLRTMGMDAAPLLQGEPLPNFEHFKASVLHPQVRDYLQQVMNAASGNITHAAQIAGMSRSHFKDRLKRLGL